MELSRVTLVGDRRRIDLVLPSREPIGRLLPDIIEILDDKVSARPMRHLVTTDGSVIPQGSTLAEASVPDGAMLRLVRVKDSPSAPVIHDVSDEVADNLDIRAWLWRPAARRYTAGLAAAAFALTAAVLGRGEYRLSAVGGTLAVIAVVVALAGALVGWWGQRGLATTLVVTAGGLGVLGSWTAADAHDWTGPMRLLGVAAAVALTLLLLGLFSPLGRGGLIGAAAVAVLTTGWEIVAALYSSPFSAQEQVRVGTVLGVVAAVVLGMLPRLALIGAGMTALDDRRSSGASVSRHQVRAALAATHRGLALATVVTALSATASGLLMAREPNVWTVLLIAVLAVVLFTRARAYPLVAEVVVLLGAGAVLLVRLVMLWLEQSPSAAGPFAALVGIALVPLVVLAVQPPEHVRVRLRGIGDVIESAGVIALIPLAVGVFGVYGRLLNTF